MKELNKKSNYVWAPIEKCLSRMLSDLYASIFSSAYVEENVAVVHVFFERQGFLKKTRGKLYDELVKTNSP